MSTTLHFDLRFALPVIAGDRLSVLLAMVLCANIQNRCWPGMKYLADQATNHNPNRATDAKQWLAAHGAFVLVPYAKRSEAERALPRRQHIYQLTGILRQCGDPACACSEFPHAEVDYLYHRTDAEIMAAIITDGDNGKYSTLKVVEDKNEEKDFVTPKGVTDSETQKPPGSEPTPSTPDKESALDILLGKPQTSTPPNSAPPPLLSSIRSADTVTDAFTFAASLYRVLPGNMQTLIELGAPPPKPRRQRSQKQIDRDNLVKCVAYAWEQDLSKSRGLSDLLANFLTGKVSKDKRGTDWDTHKLPEPFGLLDILAFRCWWYEKYIGCSIPTSPETIARHALDFLGSVDRDYYLKRAQRKYDEIVNGIMTVWMPANPEEFAPPAGPDEKYLTPEDSKAFVDEQVAILATQMCRHAAALTPAELEYHRHANQR